MQSNRRDYIRQMLTGMTVLSLGEFSPSAFGKQAEAQPKTTSRLGAEEFWKQVEKVKASTLTRSAIAAAQAGVQAQREVNASRRAAILLSEDAGKDAMARAEKRFQTRTAALRETKQALTVFIKNTGDSGESKFKEFVSKGGLKEAAEHARRYTIETLLKSDISPQEAQTARKALDDRIGKIQGMASFRDLTGYLDQHLDELIAQKMSQEDPNPLCLFILLITSLYVVLLVISVLICVLLLGLVPCDQIFNQMIAQACP